MATGLSIGGGFLAAAIGYQLVVPSGAGPVVFLWPPTGLVVATLVLLDRRWWGPVVVGTFLGNVAAAVLFTSRPLLAIAGSGANSLEQLAVAAVFMRLASPRPRFATLRDVTALIGVGFGIAVTAVLGGEVMAWALGGDLWSGWLAWWIGDGLSVVILTPAVVTVAAVVEVRAWSRPGRVVDWVIVASVVAVLGHALVVAELESPPPGIGAHAYLVYPVLIWAGVRMGPAVATTSVLALCAATALAIARAAIVPAEVHGGGMGSIVSVYVYLGMASVTALVPAATLAERALTEEWYRQIVELAPVGFVSTSPEGRVLVANSALAAMLGYARPQDLVSQDIAVACYACPTERGRVVRTLGNESEILVVESVFRRRDGARIDVKLHKRAVLDAAGRVVRHDTFVHDVSAEQDAWRAEQQQRRRLQKLSAALLQLQEAERTRISRELHDRMGQSLTAVKLAITAAAMTAPGAPLAEAAAMVDDAISDARALAFDLRPAALDDLGLAAAVSSYVRRRATAAGMEAQVSITYDHEGVSPDVEHACYRIIQEALLNVVRHSGARLVRVRLVRSPSSVAITVADDGCGFDDGILAAGASPVATLGILGMTERAALLGGTCEIRSAPGRGTTVTATFPLQAA